MDIEKDRRSFLKLGATVGTGLALGCLCFRGCASQRKQASPQKTNTSNNSHGKDFDDGIGYCGIMCRECPISIATKNNDYQAKAKWAERLYKAYGKVIKPEDVYCDNGCKSKSGRHWYYCENICVIRKCAIEKGVTTCLDCEEFAICEKLAPTSKKRLEELYNKQSKSSA
ncbi:MAG: DUF3795 domain-containing protein [Planctomycetota bacterium]|jgi:hypothetical protein